jgi:hypothetical protein
MKALAKTILNQAAFLELSDDSAVDPDAAVEALEMMAADLHSCSPQELAAIDTVLTELIDGERSEPRKTFFVEFNKNMGLK